MIRIAAAALSAAMILAAPAFAAPANTAEATTVRVSLAGKSPAQAHADIVRAASKVCYAQTLHEALFAYVYPACIDSSVKRAVTQLGDPALAAYATAHPAALASR